MILKLHLFQLLRHNSKTKCVLRLDTIFASMINMPYEEVYFQRLKEDNSEESEDKSLKND